MADDFHRFELESWQQVADRYEDAWSGLTRPFIPALLEATEVGPGVHLLDVACGPGYAAEAANALGARSVGVDFCADMIAQARQRCPQLEFHQGDAQALDFADDSFGAVVMNFGVLHLSRPQTAFAEASRVLRAGGRFGFSVWAAPDASPGAQLIGEALETHADLDVDLPKGPDYFVYGEAEHCARILVDAGFDSNSLAWKTVTIDWTVPSASFIFEAELHAGVRTAAVLKAQKPGVLADIREHLEEAILPFATDDGFALPFAAHVVAAAVPA